MPDVFKLAREVVDGELEILCPHMELRQCPSYAETVMTGSGVIQVNKRGQLTFQLSGPVLRPLPDVLVGDKPQGTLYDIEDHVMLVVHDEQRREWRSNPLLVHFNGLAERMYGYVCRRIESLTYTHAWLADDNRVQLYIPKQSSLPFDSHTKTERRAGDTILSTRVALDHHVCSVGEASVTFRKEESDWLVMTARQATPFLPDWPGLMCHAVAFATTGVVRPAAMLRATKEREDIILYSGPFRQYRPLMPRPIIGLSSDDANAFWSLVERLFSFAWDRRATSLQFLDELDGIRACAAMSLETASLMLAVGIEALALELLPAVPPPGWDQHARAALECHIAEWNGDTRTRDRVLAWLKAKGEPRAVDRLHAWAAKHGIKPELIGEWSALRNRKAHGRSIEGTQSSYDRYYAVVELLYRFIASVVGYDGQVLETSIRGWGQEE